MPNKRSPGGAGAQPSIRRVHLIFKTHLDLGFTDFARNVEALYFEQYIPRALRLARDLRLLGGSERFIWTTGSWLIYEYLERASAPERASMEQAILAGDIVWHGLPCTFHSELMDADLFRVGLSLSQQLDARFGRKTIAAKMTDVPGHTRGIVPLIAEAGIKFLHIGVNGASTAPAVPPVFRWRAPDRSEVVVMYQKSSYGALQIVPGLADAIAFAHTDDNVGPQSIAQVRAAYARLRENFPGARIVASTMDAFASRLLRARGQLPIVTQEIGDTWIHGVASDPQKVSRFRELLRLRRSWLGTSGSKPPADSLSKFSRALLLVPEHTWGLDVKTHLADLENYRGDLFDRARALPNFQKMEASWQEQRAYNDQAVAALKGSPWGDETELALRALEPVRPLTKELVQVQDKLARLDSRHWEFQFDTRGALVHLSQKGHGRDWADAAHPLGLFIYQTFSKADYTRFYGQYNVHRPENAWWSVPDFTKPGIEKAGALHRDWVPKLTGLYRDDRADCPSWLLELTPPKTAVTRFGCPAHVYLRIEFPEQESAVRFVLQWFDKRACRLPEALWFSFCPRVPRARGWTLDKMGQVVSPLDVVRDGNRHLHAVGRGVHYRDDSVALDIETRDAPLVAPGERSLLNFNNHQPALKDGMHFLLYDNVWGTNFPMWYQDNARFEFLFRPVPFQSPR